MKTIENMWQREIDGSLVCYNNYKDMADNPDLEKFVNSKTAIKELIDQVPEDVIIALGWDGTMLDIIRTYHDDGRPFLWVNFGSKWFLLNQRDWMQNTSEFISMDYPLLEVKQNWQLSWYCFNDMAIYSPELQMTHFNIYQEGIWSIDFNWDTILLSTPAGSTGHSESYNARPMSHDSDKLILTPLGDKKNRNSIIMHNSKNEMIITNTWRKPRIRVNLDGKQSINTKKDEDITLQIKRIPNKVKLLISKEHKQDWDNRIMKGQWFN